MLDDLQRATLELVEHSMKIAWFSRGSIQYPDAAFELTPIERERFMEFVSENIKAQQGAMSIVF